jgi:putative tricarboxylic transport membrane protein
MKFISDKKYAIAMLLFSMAYCYFSVSLEADFDPTKEKYFPFILSVGMITLSVLLFLLPSQHTTSWPKSPQWLKIGLLIVAILFYSLFLNHVGFLISASLLMAVCMWGFGAKRRWIVPVSVTVVISFYIIFDRILGLNLPAGILKF